VVPPVWRMLSALEDSGVENPLAVYVRNVPILLLSDNKFKALISNWRGVDKEISSCFTNKKNCTWNGWAVVHFTTESYRNAFLEDENQHYVRDTAGTLHKLKVTKWFEKSNTNLQKSSTTTRPIPFFKADLFSGREILLDEFERSCNDSSIQSFKGVIQSYAVDSAGLGHNGFIQVKLSHQGQTVTESVLFHSESFWLCSVHTRCNGVTDCVKKCGVDDLLPQKLKVGTELYFTARKIPTGIVSSCRFQAKSVWQGDKNQPNIISPPSSRTLDTYLEDYIQQRRDENKPRENSFTTVNGQQAANSRQKPLQGSLLQLNSTLDKNITFKVQKKPVPSNFAQAVASVPVLKVSEAADVVEKGKVEAFPTPDEVVISVSGYGRFTLNKHHFEGSFQDLRSVLRHDSNLVVALSHDSSSGKKPKYVVIRAFPQTQITKFNARQRSQSDTPSVNEQVPTTGDCSDSVYSKGESFHEINLEDLDKYYDTFPKISEYLQKEIPLVLPNISSNSNIIALLANEIIYSTEESNEVEILEKFFKIHTIDEQPKKQFISDFVNFRKLQQHTASDCNIEVNSPPKDGGIAEDVLAASQQFLAWIEQSQIRDKERVNLYQEFFSFTEPGIVWLNFLNNPSMQQNQRFLIDDMIGYWQYVKLENWLLGKEMSLILKEFEKGLIDDTNLYKVHLERASPLLSEYSPLDGNNSTTTERPTGSDSEAKLTAARLTPNHDKIPTDKVDAESNEAFSRNLNDEMRNGYETAERSFVDDIKIFSTLRLTEIETEFVKSKEKEGETHSFILRVIILLRKTKINLSDLVQMYQDHLRLSNKPRNKEFNAKVQTFLNMKADQKVLDDTNVFIRNNKDLKVKENTRMSCKKIEKYIPMLTASLCGFIFQQAKLRATHPIGGSTNRRNSGSVSSQLGQNDDFQDIKQYLQQSNQMALCDSMISTLKRKNVTMEKLKDIFEECREGGVFQWNLEISRLMLNPPMGLTIFKISETLMDVMKTLYTEKGLGLPGTSELKLNAPQSLLSCYESGEVKAVLSRADKGDLEDALLEGSEVIRNLNSYWNDPSEENNDIFARISAIIWKECQVENRKLENDISELYKKVGFDKNSIHYLQKLLSSWATVLEKSETMKINSLAVFNLLKLTLASFDPNIYEEIQEGPGYIYEKTFLNIANNKHLYSCEGFVSGKLGPFLLVQTKFCVVLAHPLVFFTAAHEDLVLDADVDCLALNTMVRLHSAPVFDNQGQLVCHIALLAWEVIVNEGGSLQGEPPNTGVLLPFHRHFYDEVKEMAKAAMEGMSLSGLSHFGTTEQIDAYDALWFDEKLSSNQPVPQNTLKEVQVMFVLHYLGFVDSGYYLRIVFETLEHMPDAVLNHDEFIGRFERFMLGNREVEKMLVLYDSLLKQHGADAVLDKFLRRYPSKLFNRNHEKNDSLEEQGKTKQDEPDDNLNNHDDQDENVEEEPTEDANNPPTVRIEDKTLSLDDYMKITDLKLDRLNTAVERLFQLFQEGMFSLDQRVQALEKATSVGSKEASETSAPCERQYVKICLVEDGEVEELPTNSDGLLPHATVRASFEGISALKYRVSGSQRTWRSLVLEKDLFHPPEDGWADRVYLASFPTGNNFTYPGGATRLMGSQLPVGAPQNSRMSSLSQLLVRQPSASIWGSSPAPILGGISPVGLDFQDPSSFNLHNSQLS